MAISVLQRPIALTPVYNDMPVVVQSTNTASANFQYIGVVKNSDGDVLSTLKSKIYYNSADKGVFNLKRILESYLTYDVPWDGADPGICVTQNSLFNYEFEIGEEGGTPPVEHQNVTSITGWAFNGSLERRDFASYASGDFLQTYPVTSAQFLTNQEKVIRLSHYDWLYYLWHPVSSHNPVKARYKSYSQAGVLLKTVDITLAVLIALDYYIGKFPIGRNTADIDVSKVASGTLPVIDPAAYYFTVQLLETGGTAMSELKTVTINNDCSEYDPINIIYLNRYGGFDSYCFDLVHKQEYKTDRKNYKKQLYELNDSTYSYNLDKHALSNFDIRETKTMTLFSQWLTDTQAGEMRDLITSPVVFMKVGDEYIPVNVTNPTWEEKMAINEPLFLCELQISLGDNFRRQSE